MPGLELKLFTTVVFLSLISYHRPGSVLHVLVRLMQNGELNTCSHCNKTAGAFYS